MPGGETDAIIKLLEQQQKMHNEQMEVMRALLEKVTTPGASAPVVDKAETLMQVVHSNLDKFHHSPSELLRYMVRERSVRV